MKKISVLIIICLSFFSCKKQPGEGGFATIEGKVYLKNYDPYFLYVTSQYYVPSETVYIIYGDGTEVGNTVKTSYDGSFKFNYLRKGKYKVFVLGKDSSIANRSNPKETLKEITISKKRDKIILEDLLIFD